MPCGLERIGRTLNLATHTAYPSFQRLLLDEIFTPESVIVLAASVLSVHEGRAVQLRSQTIWNQGVTCLSIATTWSKIWIGTSKRTSRISCSTSRWPILYDRFVISGLRCLIILWCIVWVGLRRSHLDQVLGVEVHIIKAANWGWHVLKHRHLLALLW